LPTNVGTRTIIEKLPARSRRGLRFLVQGSPLVIRKEAANRVTHQNAIRKVMEPVSKGELIRTPGGELSWLLLPEIK